MRPRGRVEDRARHLYARRSQTKKLDPLHTTVVREPGLSSVAGEPVQGAPGLAMLYHGRRAAGEPEEKFPSIVRRRPGT